MRFEDLNWLDLERYLEQDDRLMLVIGSCEQHGYLSLQTDTKIPQALADSASQRSGVPVAPALNYGISPYFLKYPGTLSLRTSTLLGVMEDLVRSAYETGFRRLLVLNGHGGNTPAMGMLYELANELPNLRLAWYAWWQSHSVEAITIRHELKSYHAGWIEAFPFTRVAELPLGEKVPPHLSGLVGAEEARQLYGDGVFGGRYQVEQAILDEIFNAALEDVLQVLKFE